MSKVKIKNNGNPVIIGGVICARGATTPVDRDELEKYKSNAAGKFVFENFLEMISAVPDKSSLEETKVPTPEAPKEEQTDPEPEPEPEPESTNDEDEDSDIFVFNPEIHHIEHRGRGQWFVMELEEKIYGPLTDEEKTGFAEIMKAHEDKDN